MRHILVIKVGGIGDCVNALPAVRGLRRALPGARVAWLIGRLAAKVVADQVEADDWIVVDEAAISPRRPLSTASIAWRLRRMRFDSALVLHRARSWRLLARATGADRRVGLVRAAGDRALLTDAVLDEKGVHEVERYRRAAERLAGRPLPPDDWRWRASPEAAARAAARFAEWGWEGATVVALAPGGGVNPRTRFELKRWPTEKYAALARRLALDPGVRVLALGTPEDVDALRAQIGAAPGFQTATGDLAFVAALLARSSACVANDAGLLHIAAAAGVPTVGVFGPTDPAIWGPFGPGNLVVRHEVPCQPCYKDDGVIPACPFEHRCMRDLPADDVFDALSRLLAARQSA